MLSSITVRRKKNINFFSDFFFQDIMWIPIIMSYILGPFVISIIFLKRKSDVMWATKRFN